MPVREQHPHGLVQELVGELGSHGVEPHAGRCLSGGGRGGGGPGEGGRGSRGEPPPLPAEMNHIHQELQKCTTLTHSAYTFVIMSEDR